MNNADQNLVLHQYVVGKEKSLIESYIADGPAELKEKLSVSDDQWQVIFDHLVFNENLLYKCVVQNFEFFTQEYISHGTAHLREMLSVVDEKYDKAWVVIFDFVAISCGGIDYHIMEHRERYVDALMEHGTDFIRKVLGISHKRYEDTWAKNLDILLHAACEKNFDMSRFDHAIKAFSYLYSNTREHRLVDKSGILDRF